MPTRDPSPDLNSTEAAIARIRAWAAGNGLVKSALAIRAGMVPTVLRYFDRPDWNPTVDTLRKLEALIPEGWQAGDPVPEVEVTRVVASPAWNPEAELATAAAQVTTEAAQAGDEARADIAQRRRA